jgi:cyclopropane-fatty-acyl-phospholipid synthase
VNHTYHAGRDLPLEGRETVRLPRHSRDAARLSARKYISALFDKAEVHIGGDEAHDPQIHDDRFYRRVLLNGSLGLGEAFMEGWWTVHNLEEFLHRVLRADLADRVWTWRTMLAGCRAGVLNLQSGLRAYTVGRRHYDVGNDLFEKMLDPRMIYSCGYWRDAQTLEQAQAAKLELVFSKLGVQRGQRVLDIGCGWGGALQLAATRIGVHGIGVTISKEQAEWARRACAGLPVEILLQDYRTLATQVDHIFSIGMFEHVGLKNHRAYMRKAHELLRPEGKFLLHTIGSIHESKHTDPWIDKYIFPNSLIPSQAQLVKSSEGLFRIDGWQRIGSHYVPTLRAWRENFERHWPELARTRDQRFHRMWEYYLNASIAAFRAGRLDVWQVLLSPIDL